ncbi:DUF2637 domain-containing protein [Streptomyces sp. or20]|uniref:DUF2637 domain-containing protein n=1 Tax=Streptomyces sp. or20 TaxID=1828016 RepID=UPI00211D7D38|nr:DUF2637 domain-containing protein [Streptomyces sp. or20]
MSRQQMERTALLVAALVILALTGLAFWLSYAHLAEVAGQHGLKASPIRQWAWPATLDAFIVGGELLMLRAGLQGRTDWWAITATAVGSVGSIVLNVAGVAGNREAATVPLLDYVVAAVPPTAALLAFGLLMRQIHALADDPTVPQGNTPDAEPSPVVAEVSPTPELEAAPADASPLVVCGEHLDVPPVPPRPRLGTEEARAAIERAWRDGLSIREAARVSTRAASQVQRVYTRLAAEQPIEGQTAIEVDAADAA